MAAVRLIRLGTEPALEGRRAPQLEMLARSVQRLLDKHIAAPP